MNCKTLLIIEDNHDLQDAFKIILTGKGYDIYMADNGLDGLAKLTMLNKAGIYPIILSDVVMPEMDGIELTKHIKSDDLLRNHFIILMSASPVDQEHKANTFLEKPFDILTLLFILDTTDDNNQSDKE